VGDESVTTVDECALLTLATEEERELPGLSRRAAELALEVDEASSLSKYSSLAFPLPFDLIARDRRDCAIFPMFEVDSLAGRPRFRFKEVSASAEGLTEKSASSSKSDPEAA
jgi:hypothetical protein